jgi:chromosome segregation ATPase
VEELMQAKEELGEKRGQVDELRQQYEQARSELEQVQGRLTESLAEISRLKMQMALQIELHAERGRKGVHGPADVNAPF